MEGVEVSRETATAASSNVKGREGLIKGKVEGLMKVWQNRKTGNI